MKNINEIITKKNQFIFLILILFNVLVLHKTLFTQDQEWGSYKNYNNDRISIFLNTTNNYNFADSILDFNKHKYLINRMYIKKNEEKTHNTFLNLKRSTLFQSYLKIKDEQYNDVVGNRAIAALETPTYGALSDPEQGNYCYVRLPYDNGFYNINNTIIVRGSWLTAGIQDTSKRRKLWKQIFLSAIIQSEILQKELLDSINTKYEYYNHYKIQKLLYTIDKSKDVADPTLKIVRNLLTGVKIIVENEKDGKTNLSHFFNDIQQKTEDIKLKERLKSLNDALFVVKIGSEIKNDIFKVLLYKTLQTAEAEHRLEILKDWIYSDSPGYYDSEILNGFKDAENEFYLIRDETFKAISQSIEENGDILNTSIEFLFERISTHLINNVLKLSGTKLAFANGIIASAIAFSELMSELDDAFDLLRVATLTAVLEEYLYRYLNSEYASTLLNTEYEIKTKIGLFQINYFLGYFYFKLIKQVYDPKWYSMINLQILLSSYFNDAGVTKEDVINYSETGIERNIKKYNYYSEPFFLAKEEAPWFLSLLDKLEPLILQGRIKPPFPSTIDQIKFQVTYTGDAAPDVIQVHLLPDKTYNLYATSTDYPNGVLFESDPITISQPGTYQYYFTGSVNNQQLRFPQDDSKFLEFNVIQSVEGWDLEITNFRLNRSTLRPGENFTASVEIRNNSNPGNIYVDVPVKFKFFDPGGTLIDQATQNISSIAPTVHQDYSANFSTNSNAIVGRYSVTVSVEPLLDEDRSDNSASTSIFVTNAKVPRQYFISQNDQFVLLGINGSKTFNGSNYKVTGINSSNWSAVVTRNSSESKTVYSGGSRRFDNNNTIIYNGGTDFSSKVFLDFGKLIVNNQVLIEEDIVTGHPGNLVSFNLTAPPGKTFSSDKPIIFSEENSEIPVRDWYTGINRSNNNTREKINFQIPNSVSFGVQNFWMGIYDSDGNYFASQFKINVTKPIPYISNISPTYGPIGQEITINGNYFGNNPGVVKINQLGMEVVSWSNTQIKCKIPEGAISGNITVATNDGVSNSIFFTIIPTADFFALDTIGYAPLTVKFEDATVGNPKIWSWDFNNDGIQDASGKGPHQYTYTIPDTYSIKLTVSDGIYLNSKTKLNYITVLMPELNIASIGVSVNEVFGDTIISGSVFLTKESPAGGIVVDLESSDSTVIGVPKTVLIPEGSSTASFNLIVNPVSERQVVTISATYSGKTVSTQLTVLPKGVNISNKLLYLRKGDPSVWTVPGASGSQYKEISVWQENGYEVTTVNFDSFTISSSSIQDYSIIRFNGTMGGRVLTVDEGQILYNWVQSGGNLLAESPFSSQVPALSVFGVQAIEGQNGGSNGLNWYFHGVPLKFGPVNGPVSVVNQMAAESMDKPVLSPDNSLTVAATISGYPAIAYGEFGSGKVVMMFISAWSHDATYPGNAYRANIYQEGNLDFLKNVISYFSSVTDIIVPLNNFIPKSYDLKQNYPNPFNPTTKILFNLPQNSRTSLIIYDVLGQQIRVLVDQYMDAGNYEIKWDGRDDQGELVTSGIYIYRLKANNFIQSKKMILMR